MTLSLLHRGTSGTPLSCLTLYVSDRCTKQIHVPLLFQRQQRVEDVYVINESWIFIPHSAPYLSREGLLLTFHDMQQRSGIHMKKAHYSARRTFSICDNTNHEEQHRIDPQQ